MDLGERLTGKDRILIVDDDVDFLHLMSDILSETGYSVRTARTGMEAINKCMEELFSLLLIDIRLPDMDGVDLLNRVKDTDPKIRKVIITGYPSVDNAQRALNLGADGYLIKPVDPESLIEMVQRKLKQRDDEFRQRYPVLQPSRFSLEPFC